MAVLGHLCTPEYLVAPLLMGVVCLLSEDRFEEPVRPCIWVNSYAILLATDTLLCWRNRPTCCGNVTSQNCVCLLTAVCGIIRQSKNTVCE